MIDIGLRHAIAFGLQAKIQELAEHVPKGHIPRTMTVHLRGELTRKVSFLLVNSLWYF